MTEGQRRTAAVTGGLLPHRVQVRAGGLALGALVWGADSDPTVVLVHGNGGHAHWWDALVPALVPGWRVVVPDLRGHGTSDRPTEPAYGLADFAGDLTAVLDDLAPGRVPLIGDSMGGRVVARLAVDAPARLRGVGLLDTRLAGVVPALAARWRGRIAGARDGRTYASLADALAAFRFVPDEADVPPSIVDDLAFHAVTERAPGAWTFRFDRAVLTLDGDGAGDLLSLLPRIRCPVAILAGEASWVMDRAEIGRLQTALPEALVHVLPGAHHFFVSHPGPAGRALRTFLDGLPA